MSRISSFTNLIGISIVATGCGSSAHSKLQSLASTGKSRECFAFEVQGDPGRDSFGPTDPGQTLWCYEKLSPSKNGETRILLYNFDTGSLRQELSAVVETAGNEKIRLTHGSNYQGEISFHSSSGSLQRLIDPYNVPLSLDLARTNGKAVDMSDNPIEFPHHQDFGVIKAHESKSEKDFVSVTAIEEGTFSEMLDDSKLPYKAYWWPYGGSLYEAPSSPLAKYDRAVQARTGTNPQSVEWESDHHSSTAVAWGGHCNGWAASSVLHKETTGPRWDPVSKQIFEISDFNGILAEASFCVDNAFYGRRYYSSNDDIKDIHPDKFHQVMVYYLKNLKKPVAYDTYSDESVDNNVFSGYRMTITKSATNPKRYDVLMQVRAHTYATVIENDNGPAWIYEFNVQYSLDTDDAGEIIGGTWNGWNPDFLWVPTSQRKCGRENPNIDHQIALDLMASLPELPVESVDPDISVDRILDPGEYLEVPYSITGQIRGIKIHVDDADYYTRVRAFHASEPGSSRLSISGETGDYTLAVDFAGLTRFRIINDGEARRHVKLRISSIDFIREK